MLPTIVIANLCPNGPAARCGQLNIGDQVKNIEKYRKILSNRTLGTKWEQAKAKNEDLLHTNRVQKCQVDWMVSKQIWLFNKFQSIGAKSIDAPGLLNTFSLFW